jgi:hypothetical protein
MNLIDFWKIHNFRQLNYLKIKYAYYSAEN